MASDIPSRKPARRYFTAAVVAVPLSVLLLTLPVLFISPNGGVSHEGGATDHNWGGHAWSHANVSWVLGLLAIYFYRVRVERNVGDGMRRNPFAVLAWFAVAWGAVGFAVDGVLTAMVGDDTTWTHAFPLQAALQFPFMLGIVGFGALAGIWYAAKNRGTPARPASA